MSLSLQFLGAAKTVTGSKFLLQHGRTRLLVDAGLFQGPSELRQRNWAEFPVPPYTLDAVILTHGHIDHCGYLPRLVRQGFQGPVYATPATKDILELTLPDSAHLQEEEAEYANRKGFSKHKPALPLYTASEAQRALRQTKTLAYGRGETIGGVTFRYHPAGHILGSAFVEAVVGGQRIVFSGDLGGYDSEVMAPPAPLPNDVDYLLVESTYGGRPGETGPRPIAEQLREALAPTLASGGVAVIPAFAIGRTTLVLYHLRQLMDAGALTNCPIVVDSPMATDAVELYCRYADEHNLKKDELENAELCPIRPKEVLLARTVEESKALNRRGGPLVIVSSSGMASGGRVVHHLRQRLPGKGNLVLLVGYQAVGTRGRMLQDGAERVRIFGEEVPVNARVATVRGLSAHGDDDEVLRWIRTTNRPPKKTFLVHGEEESLAGMERKLAAIGWPTYTPEYLEEIELL